MKHSLLLLVAAASLFVSCSKNKHDSPVNPGPSTNSSRIKTYTDDYGTINYTYDSKARLIAEIFASGAKNEYDHSNPNKIIYNYYFPNGTLEGTGDFDLNADGLVIKKVYSDGPANLYTTQYDANKNVIKRVNMINGAETVIDYFYTNGNLDSTRYKLNGAYKSTTLFTYYTNKPDLLNNDVWGSSYEGYYGKHLLKKEETRYADGTPGNIWEYSYEYDANGRVSKRISKHEQDIYTGYYTYY